MRLQLILILLIAALLLAACGKKGPVRPLTADVVEQPAGAPEKDSEKQHK